MNTSNKQSGQSLQEYVLIILLVAAPLFIPFNREKPALAVQFYESLMKNIEVWEYTAQFAD